MADNYGLDSGGNVVIQQPANAGNGPATRLTGGGASFTGYGQASQAPGGNFGAMGDSSIKTLEALNKLTKGVLAPLIEAEQKKQYFDGMAQVAQGQTLLEVEKSRPWFTELFGPSATVQGAQAMTLMGAMNTAEAQFYQELPTLSQQPPDAARAYLVQQASQLAQTGDPVMDAMVQSKLAEQMGPLLGVHTKQHMKYIQDQSSIAYGNTLVTAGDAYQEKVGNTAFFTPEQLDMEKQRAMEAFKPMPGMTPDAWQKNTVKALEASLMKGNFAVYEAVKGTQEWNQLPVDQRTRLDRVEAYAQQWVLKESPTFRQDASDSTALLVALGDGMGPQTFEALQTYMNQKDKEWSARTGSGKPFYDNAQRSQMEKAFYTGQDKLARQRAAALAAAQKIGVQVEDAKAQRTSVMSAVNGNGLSGVDANKLNPEIVQSQLSDARTAVMKTGNPEGAKNWMEKLAMVSQYGSKFVDKELAYTMTTDANNFFIQGTAVTDGMRQSLSFMQMMASGANGIAGLASYIGNDNAAKMTALVKSGVDLSDKSSVDAARQAIANGWNAATSAKDVASVREYLNDQDPYWTRHIPLFGPGGLSGYELNDSSKARMAEDLAPLMARYERGLGLSHEEALQLAFNSRFGDSSNVDFIDGAYIPASPNSSGQGGLFKHVDSLSGGGLSQKSEDYQQALRTVLDKAMGDAIGKIPVNPGGRMSLADKVDNSLTGTFDNLVEAIPTLDDFIGTDKIGGGKHRPISAMAGSDIKINEFDPADYRTTSGTPVAGGAIYVTRMPVSAAMGLRPVTVLITPEQVAAQLTEVRRENMERAKKSGFRSMYGDRVAPFQALIKQ